MEASQNEVELEAIVTEFVDSFRKEETVGSRVGSCYRKIGSFDTRKRSGSDVVSGRVEMARCQGELPTTCSGTDLKLIGLLGDVGCKAGEGTGFQDEREMQGTGANLGIGVREARRNSRDWINRGKQGISVLNL